MSTALCESPDVAAIDFQPRSFAEIVACLPAEIRSRADEARRIDRACGRRQLAFDDDPESHPFAHANPCIDRADKPVYAIWCDGEAVGVAVSWPDATAAVNLLCMLADSLASAERAA